MKTTFTLEENRGSVSMGSTIKSCNAHAPLQRAFAAPYARGGHRTLTYALKQCGLYIYIYIYIYVSIYI